MRTAFVAFCRPRDRIAGFQLYDRRRPLTNLNPRRLNVSEANLGSVRPYFPGSAPNVEFSLLIVPASFQDGDVVGPPQFLAQAVRVFNLYHKLHRSYSFVNG
jgi:hypothetical protein